MLGQLDGATKQLGSDVDRNLRQTVETAKTGARWAKHVHGESKQAIENTKSLPLIGQKIKDRELRKQHQKRYKKYIKQKQRDELGLGRTKKQAVKDSCHFLVSQKPRVVAAVDLGKTIIRSTRETMKALDEAKNILLYSAADATVDVVDHKFGESAAGAVMDSIQIGKDVWETCENLGELSEWVQDPREGLIRQVLFETGKRGLSKDKQDDFAKTVKEGFLMKKGVYVKHAWERKWVELKFRTMRWYKDKPVHAFADSIKGKIAFRRMLLDSMQKIDDYEDGTKFVFQVIEYISHTVDPHVHTFAATSEQEREEWITAIRNQAIAFLEDKQHRLEKKNDVHVLPQFRLIDKKTTDRAKKITQGLSDATVLAIADKNASDPVGALKSGLGQLRIKEH
eukprot:TRINITY_DN1865_c0_g1_i2.p1 TRINITY_DN1865_c0_g1~~TRINITY_DN1865_c0_g1_i2.p1  ORF type:complete len:396 (+),score=82.09 TRINITY_DN1865_c0_g1_i2:1036-2223(+)